MKKSRTILVVLLLIYSPLIILTVGDLIPPFHPFELAPFLLQVVQGFFYLSIFSTLFFLIVKVLPVNFIPYFSAAFVFSYVIFWELLVFTACYQAPKIEGMFVNLYTIHPFALFKILLGAGFLVIILMFFMKIERKSFVYTLFGLVFISLLLPLAKEIAYRQQINSFLGNYRTGNIHFVVDHDFFSDDYRESKVFAVADRKFGDDPKGVQNYSSGDLSPDGRYSIGYNNQNSKFLVVDQKTKQPIFTLKHWATNIQWSPDSKFIVYDYAYDRDDLSKIFIANIDSQKTILLAAGGCPVWTQ